MNDKEKLLSLPKILDPRGVLTFLQSGQNIPFEIKRVYWIYDVPGGEERGGHAFKQTEEVIISLSGSFDVILHDGNEEKTISLNRSYKGVFVPKMYWRKMNNFSTNAVALIISATIYDADDYIRDFEEFKKKKNG